MSVRKRKICERKTNVKKHLTFSLCGGKVHSSLKTNLTKCDEQKPVGWKEPGESCRLVRGKGGVLLEFLLLAVH